MENEPLLKRLIERFRRILKDTRGRAGALPAERPARVGDWIIYEGKPYCVAICDGNHWFWLADDEGESILRHIPDLKPNLPLTRIMNRE